MLVILSLSSGVRLIEKEFKEQGGRSRNIVARELEWVVPAWLTFNLATKHLNLLNL